MIGLPGHSRRPARRSSPAATTDGSRARSRALDGDGEETRLVGGAVRDLALGATAGDFDLATTALPES